MNRHRLLINYAVNTILIILSFLWSQQGCVQYSGWDNILGGLPISVDFLKSRLGEYRSRDAVQFRDQGTFSTAARSAQHRKEFYTVPHRETHSAGPNEPIEHLSLSQSLQSEFQRPSL